jgi:hypothetical protein
MFTFIKLLFKANKSFISKAQLIVTNSLNNSTYMKYLFIYQKIIKYHKIYNIVKVVKEVKLKGNS